MQFDPRQLAAFDATLQTGSLSAAAVTLHITLAATSLRIKALEESLGQRLLVRGKIARATPAGQALLTHIKQVRLLEADLQHTLQPTSGSSNSKAPVYQNISVAVNADSLASWFFPGIQAALQKHKLTLDVTVDDQDHTLEWLKNGDVIGCVTTLPTPLRGCVAEPLGTMRYRCVAAPGLRDKLLGKKRSIGLHQLVTQPAIGFNRKDGLQDQFLQQCFGVTELSYPRHYIPAVDAYRQGLLGGLGWGMQADIQAPNDLPSGILVDLFPGQFVDVPLFWHHWQREAPQAGRLTLAIKEAAGKLLA
jgi:LysR family transcriptional regulator, chromosome initiation inhibitor